MKHIQDYPYLIAETWGDVEQLEVGSVVIDSEGDVLQLREQTDRTRHGYGQRRWYVAGATGTYSTVSVPAVVLVNGWQPDDYPEDWEAMGGEQR